MVQTVTSSAATTSVSQTVNVKTKVVETDTHSIIMRQIVALQTQLKDLYEQLAKASPKDIDQRLLLQRQIQGIEDEISALKAALISTENKKVMERQQVRQDKAKASKPPGASAGEPAPVRPPDTTSRASNAGTNAVTPTKPSNTEQADAVPSTAPGSEADAGYASDGDSVLSNDNVIGTNVDVVV